MGTCCARRLRGVLLALATAVLFSPLPAWAQTAAASLRGTVLDSDRKPAASARVVVRHGSTGAEAQTLTDAGGRYQITGLRPGGPYTVRVTLLGHAPAERSGLELGLGSVVVQNFTLVAQATVLEQVTVAVNADSRFATSRTGSSMLIDQEAIEAHPTVERNFMEIAEVSPMVTKSDDGSVSPSRGRTSATTPSPSTARCTRTCSARTPAGFPARRRAPRPFRWTRCRSSRCRWRRTTCGPAALRAGC